MRDDIEFNIHFCELVEKYPELYDYNRSDYSNRSVQNRAWAVIAEELEESTNDCKERWKNIRGRYAKVCKSRLMPSGSTAKRKKEYYLGPHLQYLNDFLKPRPPVCSVEKVISILDADDNSTFDEGSNSEESLLTSAPPTSTDKNLPTSKQVHKNDYFTKKQKLNKNTDPSDSDLCFLKSILPDMKAMTPRQKRRFKIGVLNLATQVLDENDITTSRRSSTNNRPCSADSS